MELTFRALVYSWFFKHSLQVLGGTEQHIRVLETGYIGFFKEYTFYQERSRLIKVFVCEPGKYHQRTPELAHFAVYKQACKI